MERLAGPQRLRFRLAFVALLGTLGCGSGDNVTGTPIPPGSERLELNVAVNKIEFARGDSARITVTLRNISVDRVRVNFENSCTIVYGIRVAGGAIVVPSGGTWGCVPGATRIELDPSEFTQRSFIWKGVNAAAGDYLVFGALGDQMDEVTAPVALRLVDSP
jgi:hypothetical protein